MLSSNPVDQAGQEEHQPANFRKMQSDIQSASKLLVAPEPTETDAIEHSITWPQMATSSDKQLATGDSVILRLAGLASRNSDLKELMRRVGNGKAEAQEVSYFQQFVDTTQDIGPRKWNVQSAFNDSKLPLLVQQNDDREVSQSPEPRIQSIIPLSEAQANSDAESLASGITWTSFLGGDIPYDNLAGMAGGFLFPVDESMQAEGSDNVFEDTGMEEIYFPPLPPTPKQDVPFTDSGYSSGINLDDLPRMELGVAATSDYDRKYPDAKTVYFRDSTVAIDQAQQYIFELSSTIHGNLGGNIDGDNWRLLSDRVSGLIKDFAIKIGLESSVQVNRDIMHFIHKRSRVDPPAEDAGEGIEAKRDNMLLSDKMALWVSKATGTETPVNDDELFVGVTDVEETIDAPELSKYNKTVTESDSFKWLIESLRRELTLKRDFDESEGCNHREMIRRKVIENLPTGKISKNRPPTTHSVTFRVPGWALLRRLEMDRYEFERSLYKAVVVIYCSGDAQAAIVEDYMEQTWPSTWKTIFNLLQTVSRRPNGNVYADVLHDKTQVSVSSEHGILMMSLDGPAHTIAECGYEQYRPTNPRHHENGYIAWAFMV
ncbi:hypothetical protein CaCOL14_010670 [Colletotrichum acutatum]